MTLAAKLSNLINKSLAQGVFPQSHKRAKMLPIVKSKDQLNICVGGPAVLVTVPAQEQLIAA